jgi:hypothetical protein
MRRLKYILALLLNIPTLIVLVTIKEIIYSIRAIIKNSDELQVRFPWRWFRW